MIRPWTGIATIGAASQPVFGTTTTAAFTSPLDRYTGGNGPGTSPGPVKIAVTSSVGFLVGDRVQVGPKTNYTAANRKALDHGTVASVDDATHISVTGLMQAHASGDYVVLDEPAAFVSIVPVANTAVIYVGTDSTVAAGDPSTFDVIAKVAVAGEPTYWHQSSTTGPADSYQTSQYWVAGTANDTFIPRFTQN